MLPSTGSGFGWGSCDYDAKANQLRQEDRKLVFQTAERAKPIDMQLVGPSLGGISSLMRLDSFSLSVCLCVFMFGKDRREWTVTFERRRSLC